MRKWIGVVLFGSCVLLVKFSSTVVSQGVDCPTVRDCVAQVAKVAQSMDDKFRTIFTEIVRSELPVGTVVTSTLPPEQFLTPKNPQYDADKWIAADGRSLPAGSLYAQLSGQTTAPDLRIMTSQKLLLDVVTGSAKSGQAISQLRTPEFASADWKFHVGLRDISGNRYNNDNEQDVNQFQVYVDGDALTAQGRTLNWKHGQWGGWAGGSANYVGIATVKSPLFYYVKIN